MEITKVSVSSPNYAPSDITHAEDRNHSFETFTKEMANWEERMREKIQKESGNDTKSTAEMTDKQWHALLNKVDSAISVLKETAKEQSEESRAAVKSTGSNKPEQQNG